MASCADVLNNNNSLAAPIAALDDGFSSDGAFLSGLSGEEETEKESTPKKEHSSPALSLTETPNLEGTSLSEPVAFDSGVPENALLASRLPLQQFPKPDDSKAALLMQDDESLEDEEEDEDLRKYSSTAAALPPTTSKLSLSDQQQHQLLSNSQLDSLRKHYEAQAVSRPRPTTPIQASALETFVAESSDNVSVSDGGRSCSRTSLTDSIKNLTDCSQTNNKMVISLPKDAVKELINARQERRRSSLSWSEFNESMSASAFRASGRSGAMYDSADATDIFDVVPGYKGKVPPSPVVHRRSSREWVNFDGDYKNIGFQPIGGSASQNRNGVSENQLENYRQVPPPPSPQIPSYNDYTSASNHIGSYAIPLQSYCDKQETGQHNNSYSSQPPNFNGHHQPFRILAPHSRPPPPPPPTANQQPALGGTTPVENTNQYSPAPAQLPPPPPAPLSSRCIDYDEHSLLNNYPTSLPPPPASAADSHLFLFSSEQKKLPSRPPPPAPLTSTLHSNSRNFFVEQPSNDVTMETQPPPPPPASTISYHSQQVRSENDVSDRPTPKKLTFNVQEAISQLEKNTENMPPSPTQKLPPPEPRNMNSAEWQEFRLLTSRVEEMAKRAQEKLTEIESSSATKFLSDKASYLTTESYQLQQTGKKPAEITSLLDFQGSVSAKDSESESKDKSREWKPISERLEEEMKKEKDRNRPRRPPPPRPPSAPQRQLPLSQQNSLNYDPTQPNWDDEPQSLQRQSSSSTYDPTQPNWDGDGSQVASNYPPQNAHSQHRTELSGNDRLSDMPSDYTPHLRGSEDDGIVDGQTANNIDYNRDLTNVRESENNNEAVSAQKSWSENIESSRLPSSHSDFFAKLRVDNPETTAGQQQVDPFSPKPKKKIDLFGDEDDADPFKVKTADEIVAEAKVKAAQEAASLEMQDDLNFFGGFVQPANSSDIKSDESGSEMEEKEEIVGFEDSFQQSTDRDRSPSPLYDEDDKEPLAEFPPKFTGDGWELMVRYPLKKKMMGERYWKSVYVRLTENFVLLYYNKADQKPFQELPLQSNCCMSAIELQQYDVYGKIHTVKLQHVVYKERVGIRPGQIPKLMEGRITKLGMPLEHAALSTQLLKFGSLNGDEMQSFVYSVEDVLFKIVAHRESPIQYKQDEIQIHVHDEYQSYVNKDGLVSELRGRVRLFCLAFVSGMPNIEIGLNDRRRQGKEVVRRKDIMPMYTERWIRYEQCVFHSVVNQSNFQKEQNITFKPLDACFFELMRFRIRPPKNKELPLKIYSTMRIAGSKIEIRMECLVTGFKSRKAHQVPCEDIQIRFPIPEAWIYLFREERHWGYGSVHSKTRRPGKVKNIKDRLLGMVQHAEQSLIECAIGEAKYEHVFRSLVWRIPRLPEKHHGAYKTHLLSCRFQLSSFDLMPETFLPLSSVEFTMPLCTVSNTVVRSVSVDAHEDPDAVEKWVRYVAKYQYQVEIDYVQVSELDIEAVMDQKVLDPEKSIEKTPEMHRPEIDINVAKELHDGYRIEGLKADTGAGLRAIESYDDEIERYEAAQRKRNSSSSDDDEDDKERRPPLLIQIDMTGYSSSNNTFGKPHQPFDNAWLKSENIIQKPIQQQPTVSATINDDGYMY